jgi:hypothetical protein
MGFPEIWDHLGKRAGQFCERHAYPNKPPGNLQVLSGTANVSHHSGCDNELPLLCQRVERLTIRDPYPDDDPEVKRAYAHFAELDEKKRRVIPEEAAKAGITPELLIRACEFKQSNPEAFEKLLRNLQRIVNASSR